MRFIRKRIIVLNDGWTKRNLKETASERGFKSVVKYINKMLKKGWVPTHVSAGNAFKFYEHYIHLQKATKENEKKTAEENSKRFGWRVKNGEIFGKI